MDRIIRQESALFVVDAQCGFTSLCPEELPVPGGVDIVANVNRLSAIDWKRIDASQDWHPTGHRSFFGQEDNLYPPHCVIGTKGAEFLPDLKTDRFHAIWRKGFQRDFEAYAVTAQHPGVRNLFRFEGIKTVVICGLATNICCFYTARDFREFGFRVVLAEDASAGVDVPDADLYQEKAKSEGETLGIEYVNTQSVLDAIC